MEMVEISKETRLVKNVHNSYIPFFFKEDSFKIIENAWNF